MSRLDHIVVGARTLEQGVAYIENLLGVVTPAGGKHTNFGTHNCVMQLGSGCYFEIIAVDPDAPTPTCTRWYGLDDKEQAQQIAIEPALIAWVVAVDDLAAVQPRVDWIDGSIKTITRGSMHWQMLLPDNGLVTPTFCPWMIHWPPGQHPQPHLSDLDCSLLSLSVEVPDPEFYQQRLAGVVADDLIEVTASEKEQSRLRASIRSPRGIVQLESHPRVN